MSLSFSMLESRQSLTALRPFITALACLVIVAVGASLRLAGTNWDEGANLHPDERHMMFVLTDSLAALEAVEPGEMSVADLWFATERSPLNPRRGDRLYVYGELPHVATALLSRAYGIVGWDDVLLLGRTIGAVLDAYTILAVFLLAGAALRSAPASLGAAALYAFTPLAIQNANFFTVDVWVTAACAWCLVAATLLVRARGNGEALAWAAAGGALAGLAVACKLPGLAMVAVVESAIVLRWLLLGRKRDFVRLAATMALGLVAAFVVFRLASPYNFQGPHPFGLWPAPRVLEGYSTLGQLFQDPNFPPNWQWIAGFGRPSRALLDLILWGLGVPISVLILVGAALMMRRRFPDWPSLVPVCLTSIIFIAYWILGPAPALRYAMPALPALSVIGGGAFVFASASLNIACVLLVAAAGLWSLGMVSLHTSTHSRVAASRWLWTTTQPGTVLLNESGWDDGLPVPVNLPGRRDRAWAGQDNHFRFESLGLEAPDSEEKAKRMAELLGKSDLAILSSERMRRPMLALAHRFPVTAAYYRMLGSGELCYEPAYRNQPGYPVLGFALDDSDAQEMWSVYDHPTVEIYRRVGCYDRERVESRLIEALQGGS